MVDTLSPDAQTAADWAEAAGYSFKLTESDDGTRAILSNDPERCEWTYSGKGSPVEAVHEAMTYAVRDRGFDGTFTENCGAFWCPFCTDKPFPTDAGR